MAKNSDHLGDNVVTLRGAAAKSSSWSAEQAKTWFLEHAKGIIDYEWRASFTAREDTKNVPTVSSLGDIKSQSSTGSLGLSITKPEPTARDNKVTSISSAKSEHPAGGKGQKKE